MRTLFSILSIIPLVSLGQLIDELPQDESGNTTKRTEAQIPFQNSLKMRLFGLLTICFCL